MTDEEKARERALKEEVSGQLAALRGRLRSDYRKALDGTDSRMWEYVGAVIGYPGGHNLYELLAVRRFFRMLVQLGFHVKVESNDRKQQN